MAPPLAKRIEQSVTLWQGFGGVDNRVIARDRVIAVTSTPPRQNQARRGPR